MISQLPQWLNPRGQLWAPAQNTCPTAGLPKGPASGGIYSPGPSSACLRSNPKRGQSRFWKRKPDSDTCRCRKWGPVSMEAEAGAHGGRHTLQLIGPASPNLDNDIFSMKSVRKQLEDKSWTVSSTIWLELCSSWTQILEQWLTHQESPKWVVGHDCHEAKLN